MKTIIIVIGLFCGMNAFGQQLKSPVKCELNLGIVSEEGNNGLGVTYNPKTKEYYTAFAGNTSYPIEGFSSTGEFLFSTTLGVDARGFWYNTKTKQIEGFSYGNKDPYTISISGSGTSTVLSTTVDTTALTYGMGEQNVGVYSSSLKGLLFVQNDSAYVIKKIGTKPSKALRLKLYSPGEELNQNCPIYTGIKKKEIGLLNYELMTVEFYSISTGEYTGSVALDYSTCQNEIDTPYSFRVSYTNKKVWIYDTYSRSWMGFPIWK